MSNKSRDASASPLVAPLAGPPLRSIYERMTNPTPDDIDAGARVQSLGRGDIARVIDTLGLVLEQMAARRPDLIVKRESDAKSWTIRVEMR